MDLKPGLAFLMFVLCFVTDLSYLATCNRKKRALQAPSSATVNNVRSAIIPKYKACLQRHCMQFGKQTVSNIPYKESDADDDDDKIENCVGVVKSLWKVSYEHKFLVRSVC